MTWHSRYVVGEPSRRALQVGKCRQKLIRKGIPRSSQGFKVSNEGMYALSSGVIRLALISTRE